MAKNELLQRIIDRFDPVELVEILADAGYITIEDVAQAFNSELWKARDVMEEYIGELGE